MIDLISFEELYDGVEQDASDSKIKIAAQALLTAINDWPILNLSEPKELLLALTNEIGVPLTYKKVETYSKTLNINNSAWKMEATSSLLEMFEYDNTKTLDEIINDITIHYKK
jgi:hypothetical protein